jgi:hypothetical protein
MNHPVTRPGQTSHCLFGLSENHNETLIAARPARWSGLDTNHNETLITARPARGLNLGNHNETLIAAGPARRSGLDQNHNVTLMAAGPAGGEWVHHDETLFAGGRGWPLAGYRIPVTAAPAR